MAKKLLSKKLSSAHTALNLLEELLWTLSSKDIGSLRAGVSELRTALQDEVDRSKLLDHANKHASHNGSNSQLLIGILPRLLADMKLFPSNQDIEKFAREAFGIIIGRWEKRSRYEMIGMLVMEVHQKPEGELTDLVAALTSLVSHDQNIKTLRKNVSQTGFSWNETIRELAAR